MSRTKILNYTLLSIAALTVMSCSGENEGALYDGGSGFAFASSVLYAEVSSEEKGTLEIPIYRGANGSAEQALVSFKYDTAPQDASTPVWEDADFRKIQDET